jgi:hypothetical protein
VPTRLLANGKIEGQVVVPEVVTFVLMESRDWMSHLLRAPNGVPVPMPALFLLDK